MSTTIAPATNADKNTTGQQTQADPSIAYHHKFLPTQHEQNYLYKGSPEKFDETLYQFLIQASALSDSHNHTHFTLKQTPIVSQQQMGSNPLQLRLLEFLTLLKKPEHILEIGTFIGLSSMHLARYLPEGGSVTTIEKFDKFAEVAQQNFTENKLDHKINLLVGDALELLESGKINQSFDLIFIDGNKENYHTYLKIAHKLISPSGMIAVDDALFHGDCLNTPPTTEKGAGVKECVSTAADNDLYHKLLLPVANGLLLLIRK